MYKKYFKRLFDIIASFVGLINVKPGISGWAQVNGRNSISWDKKFDLDIWYVNNVSFKTDFKIILLTIKKVILKENVNLSENINMTPFKGSN